MNRHSYAILNLNYCFELYICAIKLYVRVKEIRIYALFYLSYH